MGLIPVDAEYHYVQDTAPTTANAGDVWLDTSQNPPVAKIYADVGTGLEWLQDQSSDRIETNLDAPVSEAGQGVDWINTTPIKTETTVSFFSDDANEQLYNLSGEAVIGYVAFRNSNRNLTIQLEIDGQIYDTSANTTGEYVFDLFVLAGVGSNLTLTKVAGDPDFDQTVDVDIEVRYAAL